MRRDKVLAVDFDGTIYDQKGKRLIDGAEEAIKGLHQAGYVLVLWTCRAGRRLKNAENILERYGLLRYFESINQTPELVPYKVSCKVCARWYIDDRNIGGFIGWKKVMEFLAGEADGR